MSDEYDLKPIDPKPGEPPAADAPTTPATPAGFVPPIPVVEPPDPDPDAADREDVEKHKGMAILGYVLFFLPLVLAPQSKFARFHANQGLILAIVGVASMVFGVALLIGMMVVGAVLGRVAGAISWVPGCFGWLVMVFLVVFVLAIAVMGVINAANGEKKHLPLFGKYTLLK